MRYAIRQRGYAESPAGSNKTKFGKQFGLNGQPWCFIYEWACGENAKGTNPFPHNANAAYGQDEIVSKMGGKWIMKKTASNATKKAGLSKVKLGDCVDFDFGKNNLYRQHTALAIGVSGEYYITIEGNTSSTDVGSQSNGGCVAIRRRHYKQVCSIARPKYGADKKYEPTTAFLGAIPTLPKKGYIALKDSGTQVKRLQAALNWADGSGLTIDGDFGNNTLAAVILFQVANGLVPDGEFGKKSLDAFNKIIDAHKTPTKTIAETTGPAQTGETAEKVVETTTTEKTTTTSAQTVTTKKKAKAEKIYDKAKELAYAYGTKKKKYTHPTGKAKAAYKAALKKFYPNHTKWSARPKAGRSCDVFVGTVIRASGVDKNWPRGLDEIVPYCKKNTKKWKRIAATDKTTLKKGDVIYQIFKSGKGHVSIYLGGNRIANAHYYANQYGIIQAASSHIKKASKCKTFYIYRAKE